MKCYSFLLDSAPKFSNMNGGRTMNIKPMILIAMFRILDHVNVSFRRYTAMNYPHIVFEDTSTCVSPIDIIFIPIRKKGVDIANIMVDNRQIYILGIGRI